MIHTYEDMINKELKIDCKKHPEIKNEMFEAFLVMRQLHEMLLV